MTASPVSEQVGTDAHKQVPPVRQPATRAHLLEGPIAAQMLRLAWPVLVVLALQTFVGVAETYFVICAHLTAPFGSPPRPSSAACSVKS
jgi:hypothetical protein